VLSLEHIVRARRDARLRVLTRTERVFIGLWLRAARAELDEYQRVIDEPVSVAHLMDPAWIPAGPGRTQPFRSSVRVHLDRPAGSSKGAQPDHGFSKIPPVYIQDRNYHGDWAQYDGSIGEYVVRSTLAAATAGATVHNLAQPDLAANIRLAAEWTRDARPPSWKEVFRSEAPSSPDTLKLGEAVYARECRSCHGAPDGQGFWSGENAPRFGDVIPIDEIGTDSERLEFRHAHRIPHVLTKKFADYPKDHPLATFTVDDLRANIGESAGYYAGPIEGVFLRAPYLHNGSVLSLRELIGMSPRRSRFFRGRNTYDLDGVGLYSPQAPASGHAPHDAHYYFLFDTTVRGNSNGGHYYPAWAFPAPQGTLPEGSELTAEQRQQLAALLEYLKTF
jgi:mono/diheme cytochrome c family protein